MDEKKLWQKISGSITYYLSSYDIEKSNEELLEDYLFLVLPNDIEEDGVRRYLDKQTFKYVEVSKELEEKAISAFIERLNKRRSKEEPIEKVEIKIIYLILKVIKMMDRLGENNLKHGKKLTRKQREILIKNGYDSEEWLLERQTELIIVYVNKNNKELITLEKK